MNRLDLENIHSRNISLTKTFFLIWLILLILNILAKEGLNNILMFVVFGFATFAVVIPLNYFKKGIFFTMFYLQFCIYALISALLWIDSTIIVYLFIYMAMSVSLLYQNKILLLISTIQAIIIGSFFFFARKEMIFPLNTEDDYTYIVFSFLLMGLVMYFAVRNLQKTQNNLIKAKDESEKQKEQLTQAIENIKIQAEATVNFGKELNEKIMYSATTGERIKQNFNNIKDDQEKTQRNTQEISNYVVKIDHNLQQLVDLTTDFKRKNSETSQTAIDSKNDVSNLIKNTDTLDKALQLNVKQIEKLSIENEKVMGILTLIHEISEQIDVLSINASITAAKAGEQGNAFMVVANEVKTLALKTQSATNDIEFILKNVKTQMDEAVQNAISCKEIVSETNESSKQVKDSVDKIQENVEKTKQLSEENDKMVIGIKNSIEKTSLSLSSLASSSETSTEELNELYIAVSNLNSTLENISTSFQNLEDNVNKLKS